MIAPIASSVLALLCSIAAAALVASSLRAGGTYVRARRALMGACSLYAVVALTNVLEHSGVTAAFDPIEDALELVFLLIFLFFVHGFEVERAFHAHARLEEQLRETRKMDALGQLTGGIAHDFNNMLGGILGAADILSERVAKDGSPSDQRLVRIIVDAAENAADLTAKLLTFSRRGRMARVVFDVGDVVASVVAIGERTTPSRIRVTYEAPSAQLRANGDPSQIKSALLNLVINARDAIPGEGAIVVSLARVVLDAAWCAGSPFTVSPGVFACISVADDGEGMSASVQEHIFEPFFTTKGEGKGTGLGLAAVYGAACAHEGAIVVESAPSKGARFSLYVPLTDHAAADAAPRGDDRGAPLRVLVVDDDDALRLTVEMMLAESGLTSIGAATGADAIALYTARAAEIDVVLLDAVLPDLSGQAVASALREITPTLPIVTMSGVSPPPPATDPEAARFVEKPFRRARLVEILRAAAGRSGL